MTTLQTNFKFSPPPSLKPKHQMTSIKVSKPSLSNLSIILTSLEFTLTLTLKMFASLSGIFFHFNQAESSLEQKKPWNCNNNIDINKIDNGNNITNFIDNYNNINNINDNNSMDNNNTESRNDYNKAEMTTTIQKTEMITTALTATIQKWKHHSRNDDSNNNVKNSNDDNLWKFSSSKKEKNLNLCFWATLTQIA